jgi:nucleotide-binding universal stress UspA family protein
MNKIVVGVDGSEQSKDAFRFAVEEAQLRQARVLAVNAWTAPAFPSDPLLVAAPVDYPELMAAMQVGAERLLANVIDEVVGATQASVQVDGAVIEGPAARVLLEAAEDAEMIVVGSRGHGGFSRLLLGSVSEQVVHHAPCPVLVHRRKPQSDR